MSNKVYVWDIFIRIFHWSLVALFVTSYLTGENESDFHVYSGYSIAVLIVFRILWGFVGSKHARFADFVKGPTKVLEYARGLRSAKPVRYLGHNPLGGLMTIALLVSLATTTLSGMKLLAAEEGEGPFASNVTVSLVPEANADSDRRKHREDEEDEEGEELWEEVHEISVNATILLILMHIVGVVVSSRAHKESLVKAMVTGYKDA